jgi:SIR2-like domain
MTVSRQNDFKEEFLQKLKASDTPPFLFIGSGVSIRYCSIPTWVNLLKGFVEVNPSCFKHKFGYYSSKCSNDPLAIASRLAEEFHEHWWESTEYEESRALYAHIAGEDVESAFKIELARFVESRKNVNPELEHEIELISQAVISGILTTNWDNFLQEVFPEFQVQIGQREAIFADHKSIGELYKIHGCTSKPETLVVTSKDYSRFMDNDHYLNAKLLTLFAEYPIIFLGYSLSDPNIELILKNLISCLDKNLFHAEKLQNRLFFVEWQNKPCSPTIETSSYTSNSIIIPLVKIKAHDYMEIWEVLSEIPRSLSVKTLRHLQEMVFEFVSSTKPKKKIFVNGIEELDNINDLEVVVGFGNMSRIERMSSLEMNGVVGLKGKDLLRDILFGELPTDTYDAIVQEVLPIVVKLNVYIPFFKYQKITNNLNSDNSIKSHFGKSDTLRNCQNISIDDYRVESNRERTLSIVKKFDNILEMINSESVSHCIQWIPYLDQDKIDTKLLREFLINQWHKYGAQDTTYSSAYKKCICLLDYLENANH